MFIGHVLGDRGFVDEDKACEALKSSRWKVTRGPYKGDIVRIVSTKGDRDLTVTPDQFVKVRDTATPSGRTWAWKKASVIRPDDWIGTEIPTQLVVIRSSNDGDGGASALGHQRNGLFAGTVRPVIGNRLGTILSKEDGFLDDTHAWFRVTDVIKEQFVSIMLSAKHAVVDNVQLLDFP